MFLRPVAMAAALAALNLIAGAQDFAPDPQFPPILVPVAVYDKSNRAVSGLKKENFRLFDGAVEQKISLFQSGDAPLTIGVVADLSASMLPYKPLKRLGPLWQSHNPEDEFLLITFQDKPRVVVPLTRNIRDFAGLTYASPRGKTALMDAVLLAIHEVSYSGNPAKALVLITDAGDNNSIYSSWELSDVVREAGLPLYAITVVAGFDRFKRPDYDERYQGFLELQSLVDQTGGRVLVVPSAEGIGQAAAAAAGELRSRYLLGFSPAPSQDPKDRYHKLKVQVVPPAGSSRLHLAARDGYIAAGR